MSAKYFRIAVIILLIQIFLSFYIGLSLPDDAKVPTHWNFKGEIDGWSGKWTAILLFPGINLIIILLAVFFPTLSPRYRNDPERFKKILPSFINILVFFFAVIHIYSLLMAKGILSTKVNFVLLVIGLMFVFLGNLMPKIPSNFYLGVRLPWTLSSEIVWRKTHRLAGWSFSLGGLILFIAGLWKNITGIGQIILIISIILIIFVPILGAFIIYKKEQDK
ncbi:MAG: SdpI family protein [Candidatus Cloacimonetes bacterium]|nr:SdpI family protein [Candidatus Cloacimonadota bacterium]MCF7813342.1 SdpI family protein [Candidatus Cloacimonadota bacterium]MCF7867831.1 SdpI family protein [Candidatus Cloacimonadota bacterium]MCF7883283.1 SdpI family protein [Candidatus Cloacimonadota bacterium]